MALRLGDIAPDFKASTTTGEIHFHKYLGDSWGILFSHPADFTPVCTTELGRTASLAAEFADRNTKVLALRLLHGKILLKSDKNIGLNIC
jgi:thioredoxin-dependent peroxiredoxin